MSRMKNFRAPKQLQLETLKFLVNNITMDIDFKSLREAFRLIDTSNSGRITIEQVRKGFSHDNYVTFVDENLIEEIFERFSYERKGEINYSEFLAATVDRQRALTKENLRFAFHHFDADQEGYISRHDLREVFRRQGQVVRDEVLDRMISQVKEFIKEEESLSEKQNGDLTTSVAPQKGNERPSDQETEELKDHERVAEGLDDMSARAVRPGRNAADDA